MPSPRPSNHPLRYELNEELHNHPYEPLNPPERVVLFVMLVSAEERAAEEAHLQALLTEYAASLIDTGHNRVRYDFGDFRLKIERHLEFTRYKFAWEPELDLREQPFAESLDARLPNGWLARIPGKMVTGLNITLLPHPSGVDDLALFEQYAGHFDARRLAGSSMGRSGAVVMTDFMIKDDDLIPMLVLSKTDVASRNGRLILRLVELDSYRSLAMLSLPIARKILGKLPILEGEIATLTEAIASGNGEDDETLLERLTSIAARVERMTAENFQHLSAALAYFDLVNQRLMELGEQRIPQVSSIGGLLERRLEPARRTCQAATHRLEYLSGRIAHTSQLISTRIEVRREIQNQSLLISMNDNFQSQLRLQETAKLLSYVIALYYGVNLLAFLLEKLDKFAPARFDPFLNLLWGVPVVIAILFMLFRRWHNGRQ